MRRRDAPEMRGRCAALTMASLFRIVWPVAGSLNFKSANARHRPPLSLLGAPKVFFWHIMQSCGLCAVLCQISRGPTIFQGSGLRIISKALKELHQLIRSSVPHEVGDGRLQLTQGAFLH